MISPHSKWPFAKSLPLCTEQQQVGEALDFSTYRSDVQCAVFKLHFASEGVSCLPSVFPKPKTPEERYQE